MFPLDTRDMINKIRESIGRVVTFYYEDGYTTCPTCDLDPTTGLSTDSFCPTCSGLYYIPNILSSGIMAHITWKPSEKISIIPAGGFIEGDVRLQIEYTLDTSFVVDRTKYVIVDGKSFEVLSYDLRGVPEINRIVLYCRRMENGS